MNGSRFSDSWDATKRTHAEIARWLLEEHQIDSWWAQSVTVAYWRDRLAALKMLLEP